MRLRNAQPLPCARMRRDRANADMWVVGEQAQNLAACITCGTRNRYRIRHTAIIRRYIHSNE